MPRGMQMAQLLVVAGATCHSQPLRIGPTRGGRGCHFLPVSAAATAVSAAVAVTVAAAAVATP